MADKNLVVQIDGEEVYFKKKEQEQIKALREKAARENDRKYRDEHKGHCFRCGTPSLVEIHKGNVVVDICVNEGCGAVHLDPGELETFLEQRADAKSISKAIFGIFK
ncbi:MAG: zf-TFIIB domain-containing protein [Thermodesulfobacteriota bacterium]